MAERASTRPATSAPMLRVDDGALSLDFDSGLVQSRSLPDEPTQLLLEYTRLMMGFLLFQPAPTRIAMIGLGGGSLAKYCSVKLPRADFTAVEISPQVIALRDAFDVPPDGRRFRIHCEDGAAFVRRDDAPLDVLLVDGFDRDGQPDALCSPAFYDACRDRLAPGGVLTVNLHCDDPNYATLVERLRSAFAGRIAVVDADDTENAVLFAGLEDPFPPPFSELVRRLRALDATHPVDLGGTLRKLLQFRAARQPARQRPRRRKA